MQNAHSYFLQYYIRNGDWRRENVQPVAWYTIFEQLEKLRMQWDLESYTVTFSNLEQLFYAYIQKYADKPGNTKTSSHSALFRANDKE